MSEWFTREFRAEFDRQAEQVGRVTIALFGKTGVGKSTLVNAIFGTGVAATGIGEPVTQGSHLYLDSRGTLAVIDTHGLEIGRDDGRLVKEVTQVVKERAKGPVADRVHVAWYCVRGMDRRFEPAEADFVRALARLDLPVFVVLTQVPMRDGAYHPDALALARHIEGLRLPIIGGAPFLTYAMRDPFSGQPPYGLTELLQATFRGVPVEVQAALAAAQVIDPELKARQAQRFITASVAAAAAAAAIPVPLSDAAMLVPVQLAMMARIAHLYGVTLERASLLAIASTAVATGAGRAGATGLLKLIPGAGSVVGGLVSASVASGLTLAMGQAWLVVCQRAAGGTLSPGGGPFDPRLVGEVFQAEFQRHLPAALRGKGHRRP